MTGPSITDTLVLEMMMMDQSPSPQDGSSIRGRKRPRSPSADAEGVKEEEEDICFFVRVCMGHPQLDMWWLRLKIPGILIKKIQIEATTSGEKSIPPHLHHPDDEVFPDTDCLQQPDCIDKVVSQRFVTCKVDPVKNGPFAFNLPIGLGSMFAGHAPNGTIIYALGGCDDHMDSKALRLIKKETSLHHPTEYGREHPKQLVTGDPITGGERLDPPNSTSDLEPDNLCSHVHFCDFSDPFPQWKITSQALISPRYKPKLVFLRRKLFAFGGNCPSDKDAPFAEVFDPIYGYWEPLPRPPFGRLNSHELFAFPLATTHKILVLGTYSDIHYTFDVLTWKWCPLKESSTIQPLANLHDYYWANTFPVLSVFDEAIYWIEQNGLLCIYNIAGDGKFYGGFITGLHLDDHNRLFKDTFHNLALLPLSKHLMGLLWVSINEDDFPAKSDCSAVLHLIILHISLFPPKMEIEDDDDCSLFQMTSLTAPVVPCLAFPFQADYMCKVVDAYMMGEGEGNIF